jgi:hypothetical protein
MKSVEQILAEIDRYLEIVAKCSYAAPSAYGTLCSLKEFITTPDECEHIWLPARNEHGELMPQYPDLCTECKVYRK